MDNMEIRQSILFSDKRKGTYLVFKRVFDVVVASIGLLVLSPIFLIVAVIIRVDSKGPIVFGQVRKGKNRSDFTIYKFRTMYANSKEIFDNFTEEQKREYYKNYKLEDDPRITRVGNFLRRTSLDELPQLINIIKGDLSIVGPRPIVEDEIEKYGMYAEKFFSVIPGLTGYWQANGRSDTTYDERVQMDMHYIDNRSLLFDFKIIFKTITSVIKKEGAI